MLTTSNSQTRTYTSRWEHSFDYGRIGRG